MKPRLPPSPAMWSTAALLTMLACKDKDPVDTGPAPPPPVDLLFLADDSLSMVEANAIIAFSFDELLADADAAGVDLTVSMSTLHVDDSAAGALIAGPVTPADGADTLRDAFVCQGACWDDQEVASDPSFVCGDDPGDSITAEYLTCVCGESWWREDCSEGTEEPLEAALYSVCRALDDPSTTCVGSGFGTKEVLSNAGMLREGATTHVMLISDEGDISRRLTAGESDVTLYLIAFEEVRPGLVFSAIGPPWSDISEAPCNIGGAEAWSASRLQYAAEGTGGIWEPIAARTDTSCELSDFQSFTSQVIGLMGG